MSAEIEWIPLLLTPLCVGLWGLIAYLIFKPPGRWKRRYRRWRFYARARIRRRRTLQEELARAKRLESFQEQSLPPEEEGVAWASLWMVELYLSSHADRLYRGIANLDWDTSAFAVQDVSGWLSEARAEGRLSASRPGFFYREGATRFLAAAGADIPSCFAFFHPMLIQLGPGVTALVANFALTEEESSCLERALRSHSEPRVEPWGRTGVRTYPAENTKALLIASERERIRKEAATWVKRKLPGVFSDADIQPPSWDLITTESQQLFKDFRDPHDWRELLGLAISEQWQFERSDQLTLAIPRFDPVSKPVPSFLGLQQALVDGLGAGRGESLYSVVQWLDEQIAPLLGVWGAVRGVEEYDRQLAKVRDRELPKRVTYGATSRQLKDLHRTVLPASRDVAILGDLARHLQEERSQDWFSFNISDFTLSNEGSNLRLLQWLLERLQEEGAATRRRVEALTRTLQAYGETLVAASNLWLQRAVFFLSIAVAIFAAVTLAVQLDEEEPSGDGKSQKAAKGFSQIESGSDHVNSIP